MLEIKRLRSHSYDFSNELSELTHWEQSYDDNLEKTVQQIIDTVRTQGDQAILDYTARFDQNPLESATSLEIEFSDCRTAYKSLDEETRQALDLSAERIETYHRHQLQESWTIEDRYATALGQKVTPIEKVGIYVPGGKASYPSSVLMNALPAKVAGVKEIIMVCPTPGGEVNPLVLAAAYVAGVSRIFCIGGAQAIAALTYGTETIPKVDKIVGPGNKFVACAKRRVFGRVGLDMVAGPSEILIWADESANPEWVALDMFAQCEHDEDAQAILITTSEAVIENVYAKIIELLPEMARKDIIEASLASRGAFILVQDDDDAIELINELAPEHLELATDRAESQLTKIKHAGAIFLGHYTAEAFGDYCAGPNHVLPTSKTARFSSPLGVYDFQKRSSVIRCSEQGAQVLASIAGVMADHEGLAAHALSARVRGKSE